MQQTLQDRLTLFVENRDEIKAAFIWESSYLYPLCAGLYAAQGARVDVGDMKACLSLLKSKTGMFSNFRGVPKMAVVSMLALSPNPEAMLDGMLYVYDRLKEVFFGSEYLCVAAATMAQMGEPSDYERLAKETREIYNHMKASHPFLTSGEDSPFAALVALSGLASAQVEQEMERCYHLLKPSFASGNAVQSLSHVLSLGEEPAEQKCDRALMLYRYLKENGHRYGAGFELATLGVLAMGSGDVMAIAQQVMAADDFLKTQKGFGALGIGSKQRLMYAGMMAMCEYVPQGMTMQTAATSGVVALVIAEQAAICATVAAAAAAAAAANSSS